MEKEFNEAPCIPDGDNTVIQDPMEIVKTFIHIRYSHKMTKIHEHFDELIREVLRKR